MKKIGSCYKLSASHTFFCFFLALYCSTSVAAPKAPEPPKFVFRADKRGPGGDEDNQIFMKGFEAWGFNMDLFLHVDGTSQAREDDGYIATTSEHEAAANAAKMLVADNEIVYIYTIRADRRFYSVQEAYRRCVGCEPNDERVPRGNIAVEHEWVARLSIPPQLIMQVTQYRRVGMELIPLQDDENPAYIRGQTTANTMILPFIVPPRTERPAQRPSLSPNRVNGTYPGIQYCPTKKQLKTTQTRDPCSTPYEISEQELKAANAALFYLDADIQDEL